MRIPYVKLFRDPDGSVAQGDFLPDAGFRKGDVVYRRRFIPNDRVRFKSDHGLCPNLVGTVAGIPSPAGGNTFYSISFPQGTISKTGHVITGYGAREDDLLTEELVGEHALWYNGRYISVPNYGGE